jgi:preprotein translocase subunit SecD
MTKKQATVWLSILGVAIVLLMLFSVFPSFKAGAFDEFTSPVMAMVRGADFEGGAETYYQVADQPENMTEQETADFEKQLEKVVDIMYKRVSEMNVKDTYIAGSKNADGLYGVLVKFPSKTEANLFNDYISKSGKLEVLSLSETGDEVTEASNIKQVRPFFNNNTWYVQISFNKEGAEEMQEASAEIANASGNMYFMMDGDVVSSPTVSEAIKTNFMTISGFASAIDAVGFAAVVNNGAFDLMFEERSLESFTTSGYVNESAYLVSVLVMAGILVAFIAFSAVKYGMFSLGSTLSVFAYIGAVVLALLLFNIQMTIATAVGLIIGFALVCGFNLLMMRYTTAEYNDGKTFRRAVQEGSKKIRWIVVDTCIVGALLCIGLWIATYAPFIAFATSMLVSLAVGLFSSLFLTRLLYSLAGTVFGNNIKVFKLKPQTKGGSAK